MEYDSHKVVLRPGDTVLLYTDGVTEAMTADGQLFGDERLEGVLRRSNGAPLKELLQAIQTDLAVFVAGAPQADDITMLALQYKGKPGA
jgi:phosphoserine phosphatase RsbU/P